MRNIDLPLIPAAYMSHWLSLLATRGVSPEQVLSGTGLTPQTIEDPKSRITLDVLISLLRAGTELTGDLSLAFELGMSFKPTSHGWFGFAIMSAGTLRDACELGMRYLSVRASPWRVHVFVEGDQAVMQFDETIDLGPMRMLVLECLLGGVIRLGEFLLGHPFSHPDIEFYADYPEQPHHAQLRDRTPRVHYNCPKLQARFPAAWLDLRLAFSERLAYREAVAALDQELNLMAGTDDWITRTRALLADPANGYPDLDTVASRLHVSSRTLRRQLQTRGSTFQELRSEARRARAITLLSHSQLSIEEIARQLGYSDITGFTRAFQRWTGQRPSRFRQQVQQTQAQVQAHAQAATESA